MARQTRQNTETDMTAMEMDRTQGVGGSDMSALLGCETYKVDGIPRNSLHIYLEKVGEAPPRKPTLAMRLGNRFEDGIAQEWAEEHGLKVRRKNIPIVAPGHPLLRGHVDRMIVGTGEGLEVKASAAEGWGEEDTDQIPPNLLPQIHHYLTAMPSAPRWRIAALLWGQYGLYGGESLAAFVNLAKKEGDRLVGSPRYGYNAFLFRSDVGKEIFSEIRPEECFRHPVMGWAQKQFLPKVGDMKWVKI